MSWINPLGFRLKSVTPIILYYKIIAIQYSSQQFFVQIDAKKLDMAVPMLLLTRSFIFS